MEKAVPTILIDNERTRVTEWRFAPGAHTGWHRHELDYVVLPMTDGNLKIDTGGDFMISELRTGKPYFRNAGVEHDVINDNDHEFVFIETEFKSVD